MVGCLRTRVRKQPIIALYFEFERVRKQPNIVLYFELERVRKQTIIVLYFESENELKFYNLEARQESSLRGLRTRRLRGDYT